MILECVEQIPPTRAAILRLLKQKGRLTISALGRTLGLTHEGTRKHIQHLQRAGWVADCGGGEEVTGSAGRRAVRYCLTQAGDHFFAKNYDDLLMALLDAADGRDELVPLLSLFTDERVAALEPAMKGQPLPRRAAALRNIYLDEDPFVELGRDGADHLLIERNCPYLNVALQRQAICSTTVSTLRRLTEREVVREKRFQDGDGCCVFRIIGRQRRPDGPRFEPEPAR